MKKIVTFGEIMLRLATPSYQRFSQVTSLHATFGGWWANVAVSLSNYGFKAEFVSRLPKNEIAQACIMDLHKYGVSKENMEFGGERIDIYFLETSAVARSGKKVYDRENSAISEIEPGTVNWEKVFENTQWFHWTGITPALLQSADDTVKEAIEVASRLGIAV